MRISVSVEYQLPMPRPPISRVPTAFTSSTLPCFTPGMVWSVAGPGGVDAAGGLDGVDAAEGPDGVVDAPGGVVDAVGGVVDAAGGVAEGAAVGGLACGLFCEVFCAYPVNAIPGASSKLLATRNSAGISFLRSMLFIATSVP